jgi:septum formation protein
VRALVLGSASPRRKEILEKLGLGFSVTAADIDERRLLGEDPAAYVARLALEKARAVAARQSSACAVLGADTTVVIDGEVLEKPRDLAESERMLQKLSGREHLVHTAVTLVLCPEQSAHSLLVTTRVRFRALSDATLKAYAASGEGMDKAGSYGIQELGQALVSEIHGSYSNVVGLPAAETVELLLSSGVIGAWP